MDLIDFQYAPFTYSLCFLVPMLQYFQKKNEKCVARENMKKTLSKVSHNRPNFFSVCNVNRPKPQPRDLCVITLVTAAYLKCSARLILSEGRRGHYALGLDMVVSLETSMD